MGRYGLLFQTSAFSDPDFGFSPDAEFPIINGKKETLPSISISVVKTQVKRIFIALPVAFVENMVPESATAVVSGQLPDLVDLLDAFANEHQLRYEVVKKDDGQYKITIIGKSAHGSLLKLESMEQLTWLSS